MATLNNKTLAILRPGLALATMLVARWLLPVSQEPAQSALVAVSYACVALLALLLFRPSTRPDLIGLFRWCVTLTVLFAAILVIDPLTRPLLLLVPKLALTLLLLTVTISIATRRIPIPLAASLIAMLTLFPIWAAPAVELAGNPAGLTDAVIAASPLTAFAVALDLDYLRTNWFYANSALGSMRYSYPAWPVVCLLLSVLPIVAIVRSPTFSLHRFSKEAHQ